MNKEFVLTAVDICKYYRRQNQVNHFLTKIRMSCLVKTNLAKLCSLLQNSKFIG